MKAMVIKSLLRFFIDWFLDSKATRKTIILFSGDSLCCTMAEHHPVWEGLNENAKNTFLCLATFYPLWKFVFSRFPEKYYKDVFKELAAKIKSTHFDGNRIEFSNGRLIRSIDNEKWFLSCYGTCNVWYNDAKNRRLQKITDLGYRTSIFDHNRNTA